MHDRYNLLTKRMQAKLTMEEETTGIDVETSELDALPEEVLAKEKELIIWNDAFFLNRRSENRQEFTRRRP